MFIIPWNTDAPIYHWPVATVGLIVANVLATAALLAGVIPDPENWILVYGDGLHPLQWISSNFLHAGPIHLLGNMFFLWAFGLIVEGKIGWLRFLLVYFGIAVVQCAGEQAATLHMHEGGSLGASAALFGLLAIACVWAPRNELQCVGVVGLRTFLFDISILNFSLIFLVFEGVMTWWSGFAVDSALLHLSGALVGAIVGVGMLKLGLVDCENWDLFAVLSGREGEARPRTPKQSAEQKKQQEVAAAKRAVSQLEHIKQLTADHQPRQAAAELRRMQQQRPGFELAEADLLELIRALQRAEAWEECVPLLVEFVRRFPQKAVRPRLNLAQLLVHRLNRPAQALRVLGKLPEDGLPPQLEQARQQLVRQAEKLRDEGVLELGVEDW